MLPHEEHAAHQGSGSAHSRGRKLQDIAQKARGRTPLKYEFTIIPFFCGELPSGLDRLSFVWERGSKVFATEPEPVNPHTRACFWQQFLRQTSTVYQENGVFVPKEYSFKVQSVRATGRGNEDRKTVGKIKVDLAQFCNAEVEPLPKEVFLQLKPVGKLKVSIKAGWLKDAPIDYDSLTEASFYTQRSTEGMEHHTPHSMAGEEDEQDLSGFEGAVHGRVSGVGGAAVVAAPGYADLVGPAAGGRGGAAGGKQQQQAQEQQHLRGKGADGAGHKQSPLSGVREEGPVGGLAATVATVAGAPGSRSGSVYGGGSPKIAAVAANGGPRTMIPGEIPQFSVPLSPEEQREELERQKAKVIEAAEQHIQAMRRDMEEALRSEIVQEMQASRGGWWRAVCCCWTRKQPQMRTTNEMAALQEGALATEGSTLLPPTTADL